MLKREFEGFVEANGLQFYVERAGDGPNLFYIGISRPTVLPTTLVVSPEGEVIATLVGPQTASSIATHIRRQP
mgnify:CR=1 FL=1